ncbi:MAG: 3'-5' exonuclease [Candidatus Gracilibacteria bacterium]|nr:3'-5' exonuclease [Candidatus Gracilibacteria bacterium]
MIKDTTFIVVDTETTDATGAHDKIVEIGAVKVRNGEIIDTFHTLLNPERFIPHNVIQIHHITDSMVADAPLFSDIIDKFAEFMDEDAIFTAHNVEFDKAFINQEFIRIDCSPMPHQSLCTLKLARKVFPGFRRYNLGSLCDSLGIELPNAHRALDDSMATAKILLKIFEKLEKDGVTTLKDINLKSIPKVTQTLSMF